MEPCDSDHRGGRARAPRDVASRGRRLPARPGSGSDGHRESPPIRGRAPSGWRRPDARRRPISVLGGRAPWQGARDPRRDPLALGSDLRTRGPALGRPSHRDEPSRSAAPPPPSPDPRGDPPPPRPPPLGGPRTAPLSQLVPFHIALGKLTPGSAEVHRIREEVLALSGGGHHPVLFRDHAAPAPPNVETVVLTGGGPMGLLGTQNLRKEVLAAAARRAPTCLHAHGAGSIRAAHKIAREIGVPLVGDVSEGARGGHREEAVSDLPHRLITPIASLARRLASEARPGGVGHVPGALDGNDLPSAPTVLFRLPPNRELLLVYASLDDGEASALLPVLDATLGARPALHLVLLGEPIGAAFMKAVSAHRMVPRVTFGGLPPLPAVARLYAEARAVLVALDDPSQVEAHALLAVASGAPVLARDTEDARALFDDSAIYAPATEAVTYEQSLTEIDFRGKATATVIAKRYRHPAMSARHKSLYS